nr:hypothetical protein [Roseibium sp.]
MKPETEACISVTGVFDDDGGFQHFVGQAMGNFDGEDLVVAETLRDMLEPENDFFAAGVNEIEYLISSISVGGHFPVGRRLAYDRKQDSGRMRPRIEIAMKENRLAMKK